MMHLPGRFPIATIACYTNEIAELLRKHSGGTRFPKFDTRSTKYMQYITNFVKNWKKSESLSQTNSTFRYSNGIFLGSEMQTDPLIPVKRTDLILIDTKKKSCHQVK